MRGSFLVVSFLVLTACGLGGDGGSGGAPPPPPPPAPALSFFDVFHEVGLAPRRTRVADMDCDGRVDVVTHCRGDSSIVVESRSRGRPRGIGSQGEDEVRVERMLVPDTAVDFCVADLDMDGLPDIAVLTGDPDFDLLVLSSDRSSPGTFTRRFLPASGYSNFDRVAAGDVDGDGVPDLVCLRESDGLVVLALNARASPGSFPPPFPLGPPQGESRELALADLDRDGDLDVLTLLVGQDSLLIHDQEDPATFRQKKWLPANFRGPFRLATGDITGDGLLDVVLASPSETCVLEQDPTIPAGFRESPTRSVPGRITALALGDLNRDGRPDLVARTTNDITKVSAITMRLGLRESPTRFADELIERPLAIGNIGSSGQDGVSVEIADGDLDGFFDVFTELAADDRVVELRRLGLPPGDPDFDLLRTVAAPTGVVWLDVQTGDLDGDGRLDLVTCEPGGITVHFQVDASPPSFEPVTLAPTAFATELAVADVDRDGRLDVAFSSTDQIGVLFRSSSGPRAFDPPVTIGIGATTRGIAVGDLDRDGDLDLATTMTSGGAGGRLVVLFQGVARSFSGATAYSAGVLSLRSLCAADLDCDGLLDVACTMMDGDQLVVFRHAPDHLATGLGLFLPPETHLFAGGVRVAAGDVNGDGLVDLVTAEPGGVTLTHGDPHSQYFAPSFKLPFGVVVVGGDPDFDLLDVDLDGDLDVLATSPDEDGDAFRILRGDPGQTDGFARAYVIPHVLERSGVRVAVGDLNGDGWSDVVTLTHGTGAGGAPDAALHLWTQRPGPR